MDEMRSFLLLATQATPLVIGVLYVWGMVDNYYLTRYGGNLKRGFAIWDRKLRGETRQFLSALKEDIVETKKVGPWLIATSFITKQNDGALICSRNPIRRTFWPVVLYVDLSLAHPKLEYCLSLSMLLVLLPLSFLNIFFGLFFLIVFILSWFIEMNAANAFLAQKTELYLIRQSPPDQKDH